VSKYDPLFDTLSASRARLVPMTFDEIEQILGFELPPSKLHRAWWSNNASNNVMTNSWLEAGYKTEAVDIPGGKLVFRRKVNDRQHKNDDTGGRSSLFGCMAGTVTIAPGVDLSKPADPDWGKKS